MTLIEVLSTYQALVIEADAQSADAWLMASCDPVIHRYIQDSFDEEGNLIGEPYNGNVDYYRIEHIPTDI
jgi:hypothetical protein